MKTIQIQAAAFFELLKAKETSMWELFGQMIDGNEKKLVFLDENHAVLFTYILPETAEQLDADRKQFAAEYAAKLSDLN